MCMSVGWSMENGNRYESTEKQLHVSVRHRLCTNIVASYIANLCMVMS